MYEPPGARGECRHDVGERYARLARSVRPRGLARDLLSGWGERVPAGAEGRQALAPGVAGLLVARVEVERVAVVGDLLPAVRPRGGSDQRAVCPAADRRLAGRPQRRPSAGAGAQARALWPRVPPERAALRVDEDRAELALLCGADRCVVSAASHGCSLSDARGAGRPRPGWGRGRSRVE